MQTAEEEQTPVILNPAPMQQLSPICWEKAVFFMPNEQEYERLQIMYPAIAGRKDHVVVTKGAQPGMPARAQLENWDL